MAEGVKWITPVEVKPSTSGSWVDVDVSSYIPEGSTGVMLHCVNTNTSDYAIGLRKNGSSDNRLLNSIRRKSHFWAAIGVDSSRIFEAYVGNKTYVDIYLVGYFQSESVFFTNSVDKSLSTTGSWIDIDISSDTGSDTAIGAIFEIVNGSYTFGLRKNGSTDNRYAASYHSWFIIGVDSSEICEGLISNTVVDFFLVGYIKDQCIFNTNATDVSLSTPSSWVDLPSSLPSGAVGGFIEVFPSNDTYTYGLRKNGSSEDITYRPWHPMGMVESDSSGIIEGYITNTIIDFFLIGYSKPSELKIPIFMYYYKKLRG